MALYQPRPGRAANPDVARKLRESEMAAFDALAKQV